MQDTKETILVIESKELCYQSSSYFLQAIGRELVNAGIPVEYFKFESIEKQEEQIIGYIGKRYRAIIDMNSTLALIVCDEQKDYLINLIHAPFYNIIVDHPMHMQEKLSVPLNNYHIICVDSYHAAYINKRYSHIKEIIVMHYAGMASNRILEVEKDYSYDRFRKDYEQRPYSVLFPATYIPVSYYKEKLEVENPRYVTIADEMLQIIESSEYITFEEAFYQVVKQTELLNYKVMEGHITKRLEIRLMDRYIRACMREQALKEMGKADMDIHLLGANWSLYPYKNHKNFVIHNAITYEEQLNVMADSKVVFNMQPLFLEGPHDRVMNGMRNGAVVMTDNCHYIQKRFENSENIISYKRCELESIPDSLNNYFSNKDLLSRIAWNGYQRTKKGHTNKNRIQEFFTAYKNPLN